MVFAGGRKLHFRDVHRETGVGRAQGGNVRFEQQAPSKANNLLQQKQRTKSSRVASRARTPPAMGPWCRRNFISRCCPTKLQQNQTRLPDPNQKPTLAWLGGWMRWRHAITKKVCTKSVLFVRRFFTCSPDSGLRNKRPDLIKMATFSLISKVFGHVLASRATGHPNGP